MDRNDRENQRPPEDADIIESDRVRRESGESAGTADRVDEDRNPPHTTKHGVTAPKFGSAGSGGAEYEPGPERD